MSHGTSVLEINGIEKYQQLLVFAVSSQNRYVARKH